MVSPEAATQKIYLVLAEREEWLKLNNYPRNHVMENWQRGEFVHWAMQRFLEQPSEKRRDDANRASLKSLCYWQIERIVKQKQRSRFHLEKQRRAGSSQVWELLSFTGRVSEPHTTELA